MIVSSLTAYLNLREERTSPKVLFNEENTDSTSHLFEYPEFLLHDGSLCSITASLLGGEPLAMDLEFLRTLIRGLIPYSATKLKF